VRRLRERANNDAPRQIDLEGVVGERFGVVEKLLRGVGESSAACGLTAQCRFNAHVAPGLMGNAAKRKPRFFDLIAVELERRGDPGRRNTGKPTGGRQGSPWFRRYERAPASLAIMSAMCLLSVLRLWSSRF
jgi:hypothetical protein